MPSKKAIFLFFSAVFCLVIILRGLGLMEWFDRSANAMLSGISAFGYQLGHAQRAADTPRELEVASTTASVRLALLEEENAELRRQLNFFATSSFQRIGAEIIGRSIQPIGTALFLNRGSLDGVQVKNSVVAGNGSLVGVISSVDARTSMARLLTDNQSKIAATLINEEKSIGLVEGGYDISVRMNYIPQNETVRVGDHIVTSGLEGMPRGLLIGDVAAVIKEAYQPFQYAIVTPAAELHRLSVVSIIINRKSAP